MLVRPVFSSLMLNADVRQMLLTRKVGKFSNAQIEIKIKTTGSDKIFEFEGLFLACEVHFCMHLSKKPNR